MSIFAKLKNLGRAAGLPWMPVDEPVRPLDAVVLPQDERPHDRLIEWWHFVGTFELQDKDRAGQGTARGIVLGDGERGPDPTKDTEGGPFTFIVSILKGRIMGLDQMGSVIVLVNEKEKTRHISAKAAAAGSVSFDGNDGRSFYFQFGAGPSRPGPPTGWVAAGGMGRYTIDIDTQMQLSLRLTHQGADKVMRPAVLLGTAKGVDENKERPAKTPNRDGIEKYELGEELGYCVWPFLEVTGVANSGVNEKKILGHAWMEHQWGDVRVGLYRWKFIVVFDGGARYSFFRCELAATRQSSKPDPSGVGFRMERNGRAVKLDKVKLNDRAMHRGYPIGTHIEFSDPASGPKEFFIEPLFEDQFLDGVISDAFFPEFWEGVCDVRDAADSAPSSNSDDSKPKARWAITELAGYRRSTR